MVTAKLDTEKVEKLVREYLSKAFGDELIFDPIIVKRAIDHDGDEFVDIYMVFEGDENALKPALTMGLTAHLRPHLIKMGFEMPPGRSFLLKSEWLENPGVTERWWHKP